MTRRRDQVWFVSLSNQKMSRLTPEGDRYVFGGLTDNNDAIVGTINRTSQVWKIDANGDSRTATQLTRGTTDGRTGIAPLPDGRVGYTTRNGDNWEIWIMNDDGSGAVQVYNDNPTLDELRATPDGKYFIFIAETGENTQLFRIGSDGGGFKQLTFADEVGDSTPSPDSISVIFNSSTFTSISSQVTSIHRVSIDGGETAPVAGAPAGCLTPYFSPDGRFISCIDHNRQPVRLVIFPFDQSSELRFFDTVKPTSTNVGAVWTPDGRSLAYIVNETKASNIYLQPIDGAPARRLTNFTSGRIYRLAYSRDGKHIYLARGYVTNNALMIKGLIE